jgi:hypothetical protein
MYTERTTRAHEKGRRVCNHSRPLIQTTHREGITPMHGFESPPIDTIGHAWITDATTADQARVRCSVRKGPTGAEWHDLYAIAWCDAHTDEIDREVERQELRNVGELADLVTERDMRMAS